MKVLIVEDDIKVGRFIEKGLNEVSYSSKLVRSCADAKDELCETNYDAIILDLSLPDGDGLALLMEWRNNGFNEPVIILSARDSVKDRITGLNIGADDYLPKPFSFDELLARVRSLFRRNEGKKSTILTHGNITMDLLSHTVKQNEKLIELTNREFALLEYFMQNPGRVLTRTQIAEHIWEAHYDMETNLIDVYVRKLRNKFKSESSQTLFATVRGVGYQMT